MKLNRLAVIIVCIVFFFLAFRYVLFSRERYNPRRIFFKTEKDLKILRNLFNNDDLSKVLLLFNQSNVYCEDLFSNWSKYNMSKNYYRLLPDFESRFHEAIKNLNDDEGHSNQVPEEMRVLHLLARISSVKTVCETGFNYGHSSFNFLTANRQLKVHSFDLGSHVYSQRMAKSLQEIFSPERLKVHFGDSTVEVPKVKATGKLPLCDLLFIDGGHTYPVAKADLINLATHASEQNVIIFDDYPTDWGMGFGKAWEELLVSPERAEMLVGERNSAPPGASFSQAVGIIEVARCKKREFRNLERGFVVGRVIR